MPEAAPEKTLYQKSKWILRPIAMGVSYSRNKSIWKSGLLGLFVPVPYLAYVGYDTYVNKAKKNPAHKKNRKARKLGLPRLSAKQIEAGRDKYRSKGFKILGRQMRSVGYTGPLSKYPSAAARKEYLKGYTTADVLPGYNLVTFYRDEKSFGGDPTEAKRLKFKQKLQDKRIREMRKQFLEGPKS